MTKLVYRLTSIILIITLFYSCDFGDNRLIISNHSDQDIYVFYSRDTALDDFEVFRNGFYKNNIGDSTYTQSDNYIKAETSVNITKFGLNAWKHFVKDSKSKTLYIYFICDSIINKYSDSDIKNKRLYAKMKSYSYDDLTKLDWNIEYP